MTIDSSRSPRPLWKQYATLAIVAILIGVLAWYIWTKELHHGTHHPPATHHAVSVSGPREFVQ